MCSTDKNLGKAFLKQSNFSYMMILLWLRLGLKKKNQSYISSIYPTLSEPIIWETNW